MYIYGGFGQVEVPFNSEPIELPESEPAQTVELPERKQTKGKKELSVEEFTKLQKDYEKNIRF